MRSAPYFTPAHISGFFQPCPHQNPARAGSRNCGPCLSLGVLTEVEAEPSGKEDVNVWINGKKDPSAKTTISVARTLLRATDRRWSAKIYHISQVPVGAGYGASGAGALGAALALNHALKLCLPKAYLIVVAHTAEVINRTGLGDVGAQAFGGLVIGLKPGAPPWGRWCRIQVPKDLWIICSTLGEIKTSTQLRNKEFFERVQVYGKLAMNSLLKSPTMKNFLTSSKKFAEALGLLDRELLDLMKNAEKAGAIGASQTMLGRGIFAFTLQKKKREVERALANICGEERVLSAKLYSKSILRTSPSEQLR